MSACKRPRKPSIRDRDPLYNARYMHHYGRNEFHLCPRVVDGKVVYKGNYLPVRRETHYADIVLSDGTRLWYDRMEIGRVGHGGCIGGARKTLLEPNKVPAGLPAT